MAIQTVPEVHEIIIAANLFVKRGDCLLVLRRSLSKRYLPGFVQPVGGKVLIGEGPLEAAKRELLEETGLTVSNIRLEAVLTDLHKDGVHDWQEFYFSGDYYGGEVKANTEDGEFLWLTAAEIKKQRILDAMGRIVENIYSPNHEIVFAEYSWDEDNNTTLIRCSTTA